MIQMSRARRQVACCLPVLAMLPLATAGCGKMCNELGCPDGLNISFGGWFEIGKAYDITISVVTSTPEVVPIMHCSRTEQAVGDGSLQCSSNQVFTASGHSISIKDQSLKRLRISIATGGAVVGEKDYEVKFASREINGEGCGVCTNANIYVDFPAKPAGLVWDGHGRNVDLACGSPATGYMGFEADSAQLTAGQAVALSGVQSLAQPAPGCVADGMACSLIVNYAYPHPQQTWSARAGDGHCEGDVDALVSFATIEPFVQSLGCPFGMDLAASATVAAATGSQPPLLQPGQACQTHLLATETGGTFRLGLAVPASSVPGTSQSRHVEIDNCLGSVIDSVTGASNYRVQSKLYDPTGTVLLAQPVATREITWSQTIDYSFVEAGTYILELVIAPDPLPSQSIQVIYQ